MGKKNKFKKKKKKKKKKGFNMIDNDDAIFLSFSLTALSQVYAKKQEKDIGIIELVTSSYIDKE